MLHDNIYTSPIVNKDFKGVRLDKFLTSCFADISRSQIQKLISLGNVSCDECVVADCSYKIKEGESFAVFVPEAVDADPLPQNIPLSGA